MPTTLTTTNPNAIPIPNPDPKPQRRHDRISLTEDQAWPCLNQTYIQALDEKRRRGDKSMGAPYPYP